MTRALTFLALSSSSAWRTSFSFSTTVGIRAMVRPAFRHSSATRSARLRESSIGKQSRLTATRPSRTLGMLVMTVLLLFLSVVGVGPVFAAEMLLLNAGVERGEMGIDGQGAEGHLGRLLEDEGRLDRIGRGPA